MLAFISPFIFIKNCWCIYCWKALDVGFCLKLKTQSSSGSWVEQDLLTPANIWRIHPAFTFSGLFCFTLFKYNLRVLACRRRPPEHLFGATSKILKKYFGIFFFLQFFKISKSCSTELPLEDWVFNFKRKPTSRAFQQYMHQQFLMKMKGDTETFAFYSKYTS